MTVLISISMVSSQYYSYTYTIYSKELIFKICNIQYVRVFFRRAYFQISIVVLILITTDTSWHSNACSSDGRGDARYIHASGWAAGGQSEGDWDQNHKPPDELFLAYVSDGGCYTEWRRRPGSIAGHEYRATDPRWVWWLAYSKHMFVLVNF